LIIITIIIIIMLLSEQRVKHDSSSRRQQQIELLRTLLRKDGSPVDMEFYFEDCDDDDETGNKQQNITILSLTWWQDEDDDNSAYGIYDDYQDDYQDDDFPTDCPMDFPIRDDDDGIDDDDDENIHVTEEYQDNIIKYDEDHAPLPEPRHTTPDKPDGGGASFLIQLDKVLGQLDKLKSFQIYYWPFDQLPFLKSSIPTTVTSLYIEAAQALTTISNNNNNNNNNNNDDDDGDVGLGRLTNLTSLQIVLCPLLESLPSDIGRLQNLQHLYIQQCPRFCNLPPEIGLLQDSLQELELTGALRYDDSLQAMQTPDLQDISNTGADSHLSHLPAEILQLHRLERLVVDGISLQALCERLTQELTTTTTTLTTLTTIESSQEDQQQPLASLETLELHCMESGQELPNAMTKLKSLQSLKLVRCHGIPSNVDDCLQGLDKLTSIELEYCHRVPRGVQNLVHLQSLTLNFVGPEGLMEFFSQPWSAGGASPSNNNNNNNNIQTIQIKNAWSLEIQHYAKILPGSPESLPRLVLGGVPLDNLKDIVKVGLPRHIRSFSLCSSNCKDVFDDKTGRSYLETLVETYSRLGRLDLALYADDIRCLTPLFFYKLLWNRCCGESSNTAIPHALWPILLERVTGEFVEGTLSGIPVAYGEQGTVDASCPPGTEASIQYNLLRHDSSWMTRR
jgi:hypothetical protein